MTTLALAYPLVTARYFWEDWFRFFRWGGRMAVDSSGFLIRATEGMYTLLSPWRLLHAAVTAALLFSASRRMRQGAPGAHAFSLMVLLGVLLPQVLWYGELSLDWFHGRGFLSLMLGGLAAVLLPAMTVAKGRAEEGWGKLKQEGERVLAAGVSLGWFGFGAMAFLEHAHDFRQVGGSVLAALAALPLAALGAVGLFRQRAWGVLAALSSAGALAALVAGLPGGYYFPRSGFAHAIASIVSSPASAVTAAILPAVLLLTLLRPFVRGFVRKAAGVEPLSSGVDAETSSLITRLRVQMPEPQAHRAPAASNQASLDEDEEALAAIEAEGGAGGLKRGR